MAGAGGGAAVAELPRRPGALRGPRRPRVASRPGVASRHGDLAKCEAAIPARRSKIRVAAGVMLTGVALVAAGCTGRAAGERAAPASPSPSAPASPSRDPLAGRVCADLQQKVLDADTRAYGAALGRKVATHAAGDKAGEAQAEQAALGTLKQVAGGLRTEAGTATEPGLRQALTASAANLDTLAADPASLSGLTSLDQVGGLTGRFTTALAPISDYCAAA